ncbi:MAG: hypothetical protein K8F91_15015, partial [Candidatus Obscuribacterales bacterium]|nr:hypothetical protein [Candidatus Obscuribacterales bacterium]
LMVVQAGAIYPALTAFTEELEKKTRSTTRLLPIAKWIVIAGKFISVFMVATFSGLLNIASLALEIIYLMNRLPVDNISVFPSTDDLNLFKCAILLMLYLISVAFISSIYCLVGSMARSFKEAQNTSSFVMVLTMAIPVIAIMPGWSLNSATALVPILNVVLACKQLLGNTLMPLPLFLICSQMLLFAGLLLYFSQLAFWGSEPGIGARRARKSRQIS